ncbi:MAG TPA: hypothetical protein VGJ26_13350, partial [Pirellulales bacterium]
TVELVGGAARELGVQTVLAMMQILDHTIGRMRYSTQRRVLAELALVRICQLADLEELPALIAQLNDSGDGPTMARSGGVTSRPAPAAVRPAPVAARPATPTHTPQESAASPAAKKKDELSENEALDRANAALASSEEAGAEDDRELDQQSPSAGANSSSDRTLAPAAAPSPALEPAAPLAPADAKRLWQEAIATLGGMLAAYASKADRFEVRGDDFLVATFPKNYNSAKVFCEKPEQLDRLQAAVSEVAGHGVRVSLVLSETSSEPSGAPVQPANRTPQRERLRDKSKHPLVAKAIELFDARPVKVDDRQE